MESMLSVAQNTTLREDDLMQIAEIPLPGNEDKQFYSIIRDHLLELAGDPLLSVLEVRPEDDDSLAVPFMVASAKYKDNPKVCVCVCVCGLVGVLYGWVGTCIIQPIVPPP